MPISTTTVERDGYDATPDFVYAVSLLAALESATGQEGHATVVPFLGMARAEHTDFCQRRPELYVLVQVTDLRARMDELEQWPARPLAGVRLDEPPADDRAHGVPVVTGAYVPWREHRRRTTSSERGHSKEYPYGGRS
jgi:hypothetical protein